MAWWVGKLSAFRANHGMTASPRKRAAPRRATITVESEPLICQTQMMNWDAPIQPGEKTASCCASDRALVAGVVSGVSAADVLR
jgi:hypothetical protein